MDFNDFAEKIFYCLQYIIVLLVCICAIAMLIHLNIKIFTEWF